MHHAQMLRELEDLNRPPLPKSKALQVLPQVPQLQSQHLRQAFSNQFWEAAWSLEARKAWSISGPENAKPNPLLARLGLGLGARRR